MAADPLAVGEPAGAAPAPEPAPVAAADPLATGAADVAGAGDDDDDGAGLDAEGDEPADEVTGEEDSISAIGVLTATVVPSCTRIRDSTPATGAGTSTVPLSISTVSSGSSLRTVSPSCLSHSATVPSSIVSPSMGIVTGTATDRSALPVH